MSLNAATIETLIAKGLSAADILDVARATEVKADPTNAARQARHRERKRNAVTVTETPSYEVSSTSPAVVSEPDGSSTTAVAATPFPRPEWADPTVWRDFLANRRRKNLTNSGTAHRKFLADVDRLTDDEWPPGRLLEAAVGRGWGAIYEGCKDDGGRTANRGIGRAGANGVAGPRPDPTLALVRAAAAAQRKDGGDRWQAGPSLPPGE
jgi:hypothetical protein